MFTKHKRDVLAAFFAVWFAAFAALICPALAYTIDPQVYAGTKIIPARTCEATQNLCYIRVTFNYNDSQIKNGIWFATLPKNAYILSIDAYVTTAFNAATTNVFTIGATKTSANEIMADCGTATACISNNTTTIATGISHLTTAAGLGTLITGNSTYQTALSSGVPLYAKYTQTGTAASTGVVVFIITFAKDDDM
jgi:hypothetical protein